MLIEVWGPTASFTMPAKKDEPYSFPMITPSAAVGVLESIYKHPWMEWVIDRIYCISPYSDERLTYQVRSLKNRMNAQAIADAYCGKKTLPVHETDRTLQARSVLRDVHYVIDAHFNILEDVAIDMGLTLKQACDKAYAMSTRRIANGQAYRTPYLGNNENEAFFAPFEGVPQCDPSWAGTKEICGMPYGFRETDTGRKGIFFKAEVVNGVLDLVEWRKKNWKKVLEGGNI